MDSNNNCFICADDCSNSHFFLINLLTNKYKTKYTTLIGDLINPEYELRVTSENKICERCKVLCENYDVLQQETKTVKSVLARQIAHTYSIDTNQSMVYMDKSKIFVELLSNDSNPESQYSCKLCPRYVTDCIDTVNAHILYHKIIQENQIHSNEIVKDLTLTQKRNPPVRRETLRRPEPEKPAIPHKFEQGHHLTQVQETEEEKKKLQPKPQSKSKPPLDIAAIDIQQVQQEYDEETLESLINLDLLDDPFYDSNLKNQNCMVVGCSQEFTYVSDYVRHLKFKHKSTLNHIFAVVRANIKRPNKTDKLICPYCFTRTSSDESLEIHVKHHEEAAKSNLFTDRINDFINNVMALSRCKSCDQNIDPSTLECNHEVVKNAMMPQLSCMYCTKEFYSDKLYNNHLALDHGHCCICGVTCDDKAVLGDHIRSHLAHVEYSCTFCSDIYQTKGDLLEHMKLKHNEQCCIYCDEWFIEKDDLEFHVRYSHADRRMEEQKPCICDTCGASFKNKTLYANHQRLEHQKRKIYTCSGCKDSFRFRYVLMDHISTVHKRTIVDNETNFYKCFVCNRGFSSQNRKTFIQHLNNHNTSLCFCSDCNVNLESVHHLEAHRERSHQDFSILVEKKPYRKTAISIAKEAPKPDCKVVPKATPSKPAPTKSTPALEKRQQTTNLRKEVTQVKAPVNETYQQPIEQLQLTEEPQFASLDDDSQHQQIIVQTEDGSLLNMNNFILTENGELIIQNLEGLLPNGQEVTDDGSGEHIQISNLEQFLMEQGLSSSTEISYIQNDDNQIIIQNDDGTVSQSSQESLMQTYKEIFEPDEDIPTELIASSEVHDEGASQGLLLNGDYMVQSIPLLDQNSNNGQVVEQVEVQSTTQVDANQSTLDELGDILLEVAAAAEKEKKPKVIEQKIIRESLWGTRKRNSEQIVNNGSSKKRNISGRPSETSIQETEQPASNFSQAYEFFVKGFNDKKQKHM